MKTFWFISFALSIVLNSSAIPQNLVNSGPVTLKLMATAQALDNATVTDKTNSTSSSTVVTTVSKSTVTNFMMQSADLLTLLENSFNTTFPSGSQLVVTRTGAFLRLMIVDSTGTNIVLDLSSNLFVGTVFGEQPVHTGSQTMISKTGNSGTAISANAVDAFTEVVVLGYDDTGLTTKDGTHTKFQVNCLLVRKSSSNLVTQQIKDSVKFQGNGTGTIRDQNVILQGSGSATISGVLFVP
jgi:hypothetical protein